MNNDTDTRDYKYSILTNSGKLAWPMDPRPEDIDILDIAQGLSHQCRFNGQIKTFYSVAQHSVLVTRRVSSENQLAALLHDASEAYLPDLTSPVKRQIPEFVEAENRLMEVIADVFGFAWPMSIEIKKADKETYELERRELFGCNKRVGDSSFEPLSPAKARKLFLQAYRDVTGDNNEKVILAIAGSGVDALSGW